MRRIPPPQDMNMDAQEALEPALEQLISRAVEAGWQEEVVVDTLIALTERWKSYQIEPMRQIS